MKNSINIKTDIYTYLSTERTVRDILFQLAVGIYIVFAHLDCTMYGGMSIFTRVSDILKMVSMLLMLANAFINIRRFSLKQIILLGIFSIIAVMSALKCGSLAAVLMVIFWSGVGDTEFDDILRIFLFSSCFCLALSVISCLVGLVPNYVHITGGSSIGYSHPTSLAVSYLSIVLCYLGLRKEKIAWYEMVCLFAIEIVFYLIEKNSGALIAVIIALIIDLIIKCFSGKVVSTILTVTGTVITAGMFCLSLAASTIADFNKPIWNYLNSWVSGRIGLNQQALNNPGISLLGQHMEWTQDIGIYNYIDSSYLKLIVMYGLLFTVLIISMYTIWGYRAGKKKLLFAELILIVIAIHSLVEDTITNIYFNPISIAVGSILFEKKNEESNRLFTNFKTIIDEIRNKRLFAIIGCIVITIVLIIKTVNQGYMFYKVDWFTETFNPVKTVVVSCIIGTISGILLVGSVIAGIYILKEKRK